MKEIEYNLLDEKWIKIIDLDGHMDMVNLKSVFSDAHLIKSLAGEMPTQDLSLLRLLLSILYATYYRRVYNEFNGKLTIDDAIDAWGKIWHERKFDSSFISQYLENYRDRFWLFHPERPFYQANIKIGTDYSSAKLNSEISESGHKIKLFVPFGQEEKSKLNYADTARWLIHLNSFDDASIKQKDTSEGKVSVTPCWLGQIGPIFADGNNLFETLMLNFVFFSEDVQFKDGMAAWEKEFVETKERKIISVPTSPLELLTLQSRRIKLVRGIDGFVTNYLILGGDLFQSKNVFIEQMTMWKRPKDENDFIPVKTNPTKSLWRDFTPLISRYVDDGIDRKNPGVVDWLTNLNYGNVLSDEIMVLRSVGVTYDSNSSSITEVVNDSLSINKNFLSSMGVIWNERISDALRKIDSAVNQLGYFVRDICISNGCESGGGYVKSKSDLARRNAYYELDNPFRIWLSSIDPSTNDYGEKIIVLYKTVKTILKEIANQIMISMGTSSLVGGYYPKDKNHQDVKINRNAFSAHNIFTRKLTEFLGD